jgi:hypothetical protein
MSCTKGLKLTPQYGPPPAVQETGACLNSGAKSCSPCGLFQCVQIAYNISRLGLRNAHVWHHGVPVQLLRRLDPARHVFWRI